MNYRASFFPVCLFVLGAGAAPLAGAPADAEFAGTRPLQWSVRLAEAEIARRGDSLAYVPGGKARWDYTTGLFSLALLRLDEQVHSAAYVGFAEKAVGSFITAPGGIEGYKPDEFNLDNVNPGKVLLALYQRTGVERYRAAAALLRAQLEKQPRTSEGGFWHKQRYPHQMWLDGLYMASPFLAEYARRFGPPATFDDVAAQIRIVGEHTYDPKTGLYYHGWDESREQSWANKTTGTSPCFWSRAMGWYAMAMVDALDFFPADHPARPAVIAQFQKLAAGLVKHQDAASGVWWQVTDQGGRAGNYLEASGSSMFTYALAKGVNQGWLPREEYLPFVRKAYGGLIREFVRRDADGKTSLIQCCEVAGLGYGRDGTFEYYIKEPVVANDLKGVGPFILASLEVERLLNGNSPAASVPAASGAGGWEDAAAILARIVPPRFQARDFVITDFGAVAGGKTDNTQAIRRAIAACHEAGGGRVVVPAGEFLTGAIHLQSNVNLHVSAGATLLFQTDPAAYLPAVFTRWEGTECINYSALIYAFEQENIAVTGSGVLDGQAGLDNWWSWTKSGALAGAGAKSRVRLAALGEQGAPVEQRVFGSGEYLRPNFIQPYRCKNVLIEGITIRRSPMWEIHPALCTNVTVRGVQIASHGPNNDGCNPESCRDVLIEDCTFSTGDDCIAIKSGRNADGRRVAMPAENIIIRRCVMKNGHGGVTIGSEISGGCRNVFVEDCTMDSPELDQMLRFKSNAMRGGVVENIFVRNVTVGRVGAAVISVEFRYEEAEKGPFVPVVRNVRVEKVTSQSSPRVLSLVGIPKSIISDIALANCLFQGVKNEDIVEHVTELKRTDVTVVREPAAP